jgi:hypothetical protein
LISTRLTSARAITSPLNSSDTPAERGGLKERNIAGKSAEVACMVGDSLKFQQKCANAQSFIVRGRESIRERTLHQLGERGRGGGRVASAGFGKCNLTRQIPVCVNDSLFDPTMLISKKYLEVEHILAHTLKAEVARLDNPRMDWSDGNLMSVSTLQRHNLFGGHIATKRIKLRQSFINR